MKSILLVAAAITILGTGQVHSQKTDRQTLRAELISITTPANDDQIAIQTGRVEHAKKSVFLASLFSLILPGAGELYTDAYSRGQYFTIAEGALWLTYGGFQMYGNLARNDAREFAAVNAGFSLSGKDDQFYVDIGNFDNIYQYNDKKLQDRSPDLLYSVTPGTSWQWNSALNRQRFKNMRISSDNVLYNSRFIIAVVIANHIASAISAGNAAATYNRNIESGTGSIEWHVGPQIMAASGIPDGLALGFEARF